MKLIVLYGPPAAGKYTIAKLLAEETGYKLFHNHLTVDLLKSVFTFGTPNFFELSTKIRLEIFEEASRQNIPGIIFTFVYDKNTSDSFVKKLKEVVESNNGEVSFIQIRCEKSELIKRVKDESRKEFKKINSQENLLKMLNNGDFISSIPFVETHLVNSTNLSVNETLEEVLELI